MDKLKLIWSIERDNKKIKWEVDISGRFNIYSVISSNGKEEKKQYFYSMKEAKECFFSIKLEFGV